MLARRCCFFLLLFFVLTGCSARQTPDRSLSAALPPLPPPMEEEGIRVLSDDEALRMVERLKYKPGTLEDWTQVNMAAFQSFRHVSKRPADQTALLLPDTPELAAILPPASDQPRTAGRAITYGHLTSTLERLQRLLPSLHRNPELLAKEFIWLRSGPDYSFTGYYEPLIRVSAVKTDQFRYPLYRKPADLKRIIARRGQYHSREAIDRHGVLRGRGLELAWAADPVDIFILQIQGSGRLLYEDGTRRSILYAGQNRHAYKAIGRIMKEQGLIEDPVTMPAIRRWLREHPEQTPEILYMNPSYVFFRLGKKHAEGSFGSMGYVLTPWLSAATDTSVLPSGLTTFMSVLIPDLAGGERPLYGLVFPQDRGGAIHGHRVDLFFGNGPEAEYAAGCLNSRGMVVILLARDHTTQRAAE